jgi:hypothetical protein
MRRTVPQGLGPPASRHGSSQNQGMRCSGGGISCARRGFQSCWLSTGDRVNGNGGAAARFGSSYRVYVIVQTDIAVWFHLQLSSAQLY